MLPVVGWEEWDEAKIDEKGEIESLSELIQGYIRIFLENRYVSGTILASVILLSIFIFVEIVRFTPGFLLRRDIVVGHIRERFRSMAGSIL